MANTSSLMSVLDQIEDSQATSDANVLVSLTNVYEKAAVLFESYNGTEEVCKFDLFQEGGSLFMEDEFVTEADASTSTEKQYYKDKGFRRLGDDGKLESIAKSIFMAPIRLIGKIIDIIKGWFGKDDSKSDATVNLTTKEGRNLFYKIWQFATNKIPDSTPVVVAGITLPAAAVTGLIGYVKGWFSKNKKEMLNIIKEATKATKGRLDKLVASLSSDDADTGVIINDKDEVLAPYSFEDLKNILAEIKKITDKKVEEWNYTESLVNFNTDGKNKNIGKLDDIRKNRADLKKTGDALIKTLTAKKDELNKKAAGEKATDADKETAKRISTVVSNIAKDIVLVQNLDKALDKQIGSVADASKGMFEKLKEHVSDFTSNAWNAIKGIFKKDNDSTEPPTTNTSEEAEEEATAEDTGNGGGNTHETPADTATEEKEVKTLSRSKIEQQINSKKKHIKNLENAADTISKSEEAKKNGRDVEIQDKIQKANDELKALEAKLTADSFVDDIISDEFYNECEAIFNECDKLIAEAYSLIENEEEVPAEQTTVAPARSAYDDYFNN